MNSVARVTVASLAREARIEHDEALVRLWDVGIDRVRRPEDSIPPGVREIARAAVGLATREELVSFDYWATRLDTDADGVKKILAERGIPVSARAENIPRQGVSELKAAARSLGQVQLESSERRPEPLEPEEPLGEWEIIGKVRQLVHLSPDEVFRIHERLFQDFQGSSDPFGTPGIRSDALFESACARPLTALGETLKYPSVEMAASALAHSLVHTHPFWNGNKRTALVSYLVTLEINGLMVTCSDDDLFRFILQVAQHGLVPKHWGNLADREVAAMSSWTKSNSRQIRHGDRPLKWYKFRRMLADYGCTSEVASNVGNRIDIYRETSARSRLGFRRRRILRSRVPYKDEGRDVDRAIIRKVRADLHLDVDHGIDSAAFYDNEPTSAGEFIQQYRGILNRLARL